MPGVVPRDEQRQPGVSAAGERPDGQPPRGLIIAQLAATDQDGLGGLPRRSRLQEEAAGRFERGDDLSYLMAVPVAGTVESPEGVVGELSEQTVILGGD